MNGNAVRYTNSVSLAELPQSQRALQLAIRWIKRHVAELDFN